MSVPFERTTSSLTADGGHMALAGAAAGLTIAMLWLAWLFLAQVPLYVQARDARPEADGAYSVTVDLVLAARLKPGQQASLQPATTDIRGAAAPLLAATVTKVDSRSGLVRIELDDAEARPAGGTVWLIAEQVSPATLIAHALGQTFAAP